MYLQLAESAEAEIANPYIYVPDPTGRTKGIRVREDLFDDLDDVEYYRLMRDLAPFQQKVRQEGLSESAFLADRASRRAKRAERDARREEKKQLKNEKIAAKNQIKMAKAEAKSSGRNFSVMDSVTGILGGIIGTKAGIEPAVDYPPDEPPLPPEPPKSNTGLYIGLGLGGLALAGIIFAATRKSSNS